MFQGMGGQALPFLSKVSKAHMKRYMPTLLFLLIVLGCASFFVLFFLKNGLGGSLSLIGYILLAASILSFLFFLSIDPGYGWVKSTNLHKNHRLVLLFIVLFIVSVSFIVLGQMMGASQVRPVDANTGDVQMEYKFPDR